MWTASAGASVAGLVNGGGNDGDGNFLGSPSSLRDHDGSGMEDGDGDDMEENAFSPVTTSVSVSALSAMEDAEDDECVGAEDVQIDALVIENHPVHQNGNVSTIEMRTVDMKGDKHVHQHDDDADARNTATAAVSSPSAAPTTTTTTAGSAIAASPSVREDVDASVITTTAHEEAEETHMSQQQPEPHPHTLEKVKIGGGIGKRMTLSSPSAPKYAADADREGHHTRERNQKKNSFFCCFGL